MKKILLFSLTLAGLFLRGQILNPDFESVTSGKPDNWNTTASGYDTYYIRDTLAAHSGSHAAFIKGFGNQSYAIQGAVLGTFTLNARPAALTGWYKCNIVSGDSLVFYVNMYQSPVFTGSVANGFSFTQTSTATYKQFTATIDYSGFPPGNAGSTYIGIYFSGNNVDSQGVTIPQSGTWAMIDELTFVDTPTLATAINAESQNLALERVYPQPATDMVNVVYTLSQTALCKLQLLDLTGKEVKTVFVGEKQLPGRYKAEIDISALAPGIYFSRLAVGNEFKIAKIIKH